MRRRRAPTSILGRCAINGSRSSHPHTTNPRRRTACRDTARVRTTAADRSAGKPTNPRLGLSHIAPCSEITTSPIISSGQRRWRVQTDGLSYGGVAAGDEAAGWRPWSVRLQETASPRSPQALGDRAAQPSVDGALDLRISIDTQRGFAEFKTDRRRRKACDRFKLPNRHHDRYDAVQGTLRHVERLHSIVCSGRPHELVQLGKPDAENFLIRTSLMSAARASSSSC